MYAVAAQLTPDTYFELARDTYAEMRETGISAVGEFHYLHHQPDGTPYADPNEMGKALRGGADEAGIRIRLLDTCYLTGGDRPAARGRAGALLRRRRRGVGGTSWLRSTTLGSVLRSTRSARSRATS